MPACRFNFNLQVKCHACVGGTSVREDARILGAGVHVVVGTPGRVYDMLRRRNLRADSIKMFVLDEADEMLSRGFKDQIYDIFQLLPPKLQVGAGCCCAGTVLDGAGHSRAQLAVARGHSLDELAGQSCCRPVFTGWCVLRHAAP